MTKTSDIVNGVANVLYVDQIGNLSISSYDY